MTNVKFDNSGFKIIKDALSDKYKTRVGILGGDAAKSHGDGMTNVEVGSIHEFGSITRNIPPRSFLRIPLELKIWDWVKINKDSYYELMKINKLKKWYKMLGIEAEAIVKEAFETSGFGTWAPLSPKTIARRKNGSDLPLNDTGQLKNSISSQVLNDK